MKFVKYNTKEEFLKENLDLLLCNEDKNEVLLGIVLYHDEEKTKNWFFGKIEDNDKVKIIFLIDDDKKGLLIDFLDENIDENILEFLFDTIIKNEIILKEILCTEKYSYIISKIYLLKTNQKIYNRYFLDIFKLIQIKEKYKLEGNEQLIKIDNNYDISVLKQIVKDIYLENYKGKNCSDDDAIKIVNSYIKKGLYLLTDEDRSKVYCHAVIVRKQINGCTIGAVISPKEYRGKGYGKKCVYAMCNELLEQGYKFIALQVREDNIAARSVYERIGFEKVDKIEKIFFE